MVQPPTEFTDFDREISRIETEIYPKSADGLVDSEVVTPLLRAMVNHSASPLAHMWSVDPRNARLILTTHAFKRCPAGYDPSQPLELSTNDSLIGKSVESRGCEFFRNLTSIEGRRKFRLTSLIKQFELCQVLAIPVPNIGNPHQTLYTISWFFSDPLRGESIRWLRQRMLAHSRLLSDAIESNLRERCYRASLAVSQTLGNLWEDNKMVSQPRTALEVYTTFARTVSKAIDCQDVTVFVEDEHNSKLVRVATTNPTPMGSECPELIKKSRSINREALLTNIANNSNQTIFSQDEHHLEWQSCICIPLHNVGGKCRGVIRCIRGCPKDSERRYLLTYEDVAIVQAMEQAFGPSLEMLLAAEQRDFSLQKLTHELRVPITAFRNILQKMEGECKAKEFKFRYPHFREANRYADLMNRLLKELDFVRKGPSLAQLTFQDTRLVSEVIAPANRFIAPILRQHGFTAWQLKYAGFEELPTVYIDAAFITQVLFNLLENAIKYFPQERPKREFLCRVEGRMDSGFVEIAVIDNGNVIPPEDRPRIFEKGYRGKSAANDPGGSGLGLWVSRAVVERHPKASLRLDEEVTDRNRFVIRIPTLVTRHYSMADLPFLSVRGHQ
jgi:signal transduction histidine kinase